MCTCWFDFVCISPVFAVVVAVGTAAVLLLFVLFFVFVCLFVCFCLFYVLLYVDVVVGVVAAAAAAVFLLFCLVLFHLLVKKTKQKNFKFMETFLLILDLRFLFRFFSTS